VSKSVTNQTEPIERQVPLKEAAAIFGVSIWTVRFWVQHGKIKSTKVEGSRRIPESAIRRKIADGTAKQSAQSDQVEVLKAAA